MGKKHKHEEHANHERWVISYADMVTLLFALFVVLYAIGETKLAKLKDVAQSIKWAFHFEGEGKTQDEGIFSKGQAGGELIEGVPMITAQKGPMKEFILRTLPDQFEEETGKSLDLQLSDDSIAFSAPLSAFFSTGSYSMKPTLVQQWLGDLVAGTLTFASEIRVIIKAPDVVVGRRPNGTVVRASALCYMRLDSISQILKLMPSVIPEKLYGEFTYVPSRPGVPWEDVGTITISFSNNS